MTGRSTCAIAELHRPPIAVVRRDIPAVGVAAAELLLAELDDTDDRPREVVLPTEFVARASCGPAPA